MIDTSGINLLSLAGADTNLKRVAGTNGGEWAGSCPFCGGKDRFRVQPNHSKGGRWYCRGCGDNHWHDAIDYIIYRDRVNFLVACEMLRVPGNIQPDRAANAKQHRVFETGRVQGAFAIDRKMPRSLEWQQEASRFQERCTDILWSKAGKQGWDYLEKRGLVHKSVIAAADLGFNPKEYRARWGNEIVTFPPGIVIPWLIQGKYWGINVRNLSTKGGKYKRATGSINSIYRIQYVRCGCTVVMVETEFDALIIRQELFDLNLPVVPVATGSITWGRPLQWLMNIAIADQVLIAFDLESELEKLKAIEAAARWWLDNLGGKARRLLPTRHDVTDMLTAGEDIREWIMKASGVQPIPVNGPSSSEEMLAVGWPLRPLFPRRG